MFFFIFIIENLIAKLIIKKLCIFIRRKEVFYTFNVLSRSDLLNLITTTCVGVEERERGVGKMNEIKMYVQ